jgi:hypothetical protein
MKVDWRPVARDALIATLILWAGARAFESMLPDPSEIASWAVRVFLMSIGFCISGCLFRAREGRIKHVGRVALLVWAISFVNLFTAPDRYLLNWVFSLWPIALGAAIGGGASLLIVKDSGGDATEAPTAPEA